jgi:signal transduction histidine kinase
LNLRRFLYDSTALRVRAQAKPVIEGQVSFSASEELETIAGDLSRSLTSLDTTATIFNRQGKLLANGRRLPEEPIAARPWPDLLRRALDGEKEITYRNSSDGERALVSLVPVRRGPGSPEVVGVVQLTTRLAAVDQILSRQKKMLSLGVILAVGLGLVGELWLTRSALDPLKRVIGTIQRIAAGDLGGRVQLPQRQDEVGQLATAVDRMAGSIETTLESQRRFVAAAAHELRTPLSALLGSVDVLQRGSQDDPAAARSLLQGMHREATRLNRLTDQLLALTRLEEPATLRLRRINLADFLDEVVKSVRYLVEGRTFRIVRGPDSQLEADPDLLEQVFLNLIDNAVHHSDAHGVIEVGWNVDKNSVMIWVVDNGEGILPEDLPHIFEAFYRGDRSRSRRHGGSGLGLAIVREIIQAHDGVIQVDSELGHGTCFVILLPLRSRGPSELGEHGQGSGGLMEIAGGHLREVKG